MSEELSKYTETIIRHLCRAEPGREYSADENITLLFVTNGAEQYGVTEEMLEYIKEHPDARLEELHDYFSSIIPPLEIVDDEELDEDDRTGD